jgi:type IV pilus assembly protein PilB
MVTVVKRAPQDPEEKEQKEEELLERLAETSKEEEALRLAAKAGLPYIDLSLFPVEPEAVALFPRADAETLKMALFQTDRETARFGFVDPDNEASRSRMETFAKERKVAAKAYVISESSLEKALSLYKKTPFIEHLDDLRISLSGEDLAAFESNFGELLSLKEGGNIKTSRVMEIILAGAGKMRASDIHVEPGTEGARLRYRIDGLLEDIGELSPEVFRLLLSRIKMLGKLKLNVRDRAQDGHFFITQNDERIDIRVSLIPSNHGETINLRLLNSAQASVPLEDLGLRGSAFEEIRRQIDKPNGMIVNTGPTGSGKTTTLYSLLRSINAPEKKIITIEDPIEYALPGVVQTEASKEEGYSFAQALRAIVRQDPDVILVGEIRDAETAETAINAALTGHLVFTTLHTNNAPASITRLGELGVSPKLIGSAINVFIGQRLVRVLCEACREAYAPASQTVKAIEKLFRTIPKNAGVAVPKTIPTLYRPHGCEKCNMSGYRGRIGIFEVFPVRDRVVEEIEAGAPEHQIREAARADGMLTMNQDGVLKVVEGVTTFEEVWEHTDHDEDLEALYRDILAEERGPASGE